MTLTTSASRRTRTPRSPAPQSRTWVIREDPIKGSSDVDFSILRNGRQLTTGHTELYAKRYVSERMASNDRVLHEMIGGYRRDITRGF